VDELLTLDQVKAHVSVLNADHDDELTVLLAGAIRYGEKQTSRAVADLSDQDKALFVVAVLQIVAHWYANREAVAVGPSIAVNDVPQSADRIFGLLAEVSVA
jgi:uncharacterized phage protein (predicted DNA packaging)